MIAAGAVAICPACAEKDAGDLYSDVRRARTSSGGRIAAENLAHVDATLNYLAEMLEKPVTYQYKPPAGIPQTTRKNNPRTMAIYDGRPLARELSLDTHGFGLIAHRTAVTDFYDEHQVREVYYPEMERLVQEVSAARTLVFDHIVRSVPKYKRGEPGVKAPATAVHNDYTLKSAPQRVRDLLPPSEAEELLKHRFAIINVWRPIRGPLQDAPIAVCDARTITLQDFVASDLRYPDRNGEVYTVTYNPLHRWYYFPMMQVGEALLLKCYDSAQDGRARFTAHTAFVDPTMPPDAPGRESIEVRTLVFYPPGQ